MCNIARLFFTVMVGVMFASVAGPTTLILSGQAISLGNTFVSPFTDLGISLLTAGYGSSPDGQNVVYWSDLNSENACDVSTAIYQLWSQPNGMCHQCNEHPVGGCFSVPSDTQYKITMVFMTIAIAIVLAVIQLTDFILCGCTGCCCRPLEILLSLLLMVSAVLTFPFWTTTGLGGKIVSSFQVVPLNDPAAQGQLVPSDPVKMTSTVGYNLMCAGLAFSFCGVLAVGVPSPSNRPRQASNGDKRGLCGELFCCLFCCCRKKEEPAPPPAAAPAPAAPVATPVPVVETPSAPAPPVTAPFVIKSDQDALEAQPMAADDNNTKLAAV
ncbi:hypothetical protein BASA81_003760 [Batrachochytrium salamandrivorans]|nr:hypothetical protein BASA81_003760 [Batrachochytrium salamandrivorans]